MKKVQPHLILYNIPTEYIERFRDQITCIDLQFRGTKETVRNARSEKG